MQTHLGTQGMRFFVLGCQQLHEAGVLGARPGMLAPLLQQG